MKKTLLLAVLAVFAACTPQNKPTVKDPIMVSSPQPTEQITKVSLSEQEQGYVSAGNSMAFNLFSRLEKAQGGKNFIYSPLSIQYALGMTANGASDETLTQIVSALGFGEDIESLNTYCNKLLNQLPAVDLGVKLSLADAIIVNELYPLLPAFKERVESTFYAVVENMPFTDPALVAARINDWSSRNTAGLIDKMLDPSDIGPQDIAYLMNALYFKAPWVPEGAEPLFKEELTSEKEFYDGGCIPFMIPTMQCRSSFRYAKQDGFQVLEIPYAHGKFAMYILLPDGVDAVDWPEDEPEPYSLSSLMEDFPTLDWNGIVAFLKEREVILNLPRFETSSSFELNSVLQALGITRAFTGDAQFDRMFADENVRAAISRVIQKARIKVIEGGTEAAAVTVVGMKNTSAPIGEDEPVKFICNHPFAYLIAEKTSGAILFMGAYKGN
jgi:serpin B